MSYKCSFVDNELYGPEDVNEVVGDLVGAGVAPFISKDSYNPSDLNSLTAGMVSSGVQLGGCKVSRVSETEVLVAPGIIYFGNGLRLKVTEAHSITVPKNTPGTIYGYYNNASGEGTIKRGNGVTLAKTDSIIPLARIYADGTITDVREFAESKIVTLGTNTIYSIPEDKVTAIPSFSIQSDGYYKIVEIDLTDINLNRFNYLLYKYADDYAGSEFNLLEGYWNFKEDTEKCFFNESAGMSGTESMIKITRNFNKIIIYYQGDLTTTEYLNMGCMRIYRGKSYFKLI